ncbi:hypothetical protein Pmani_037874 [Petrolisthes manimaculis]|uniref:Sulfotransferase domain-containing protein n=1 Tax=Petrolisthes manimaculis TaxID=1843537 RepID=A0AAE1TL07_9EUCA|nr:hypothetical protein Pmani_037874 [Petrolisthes manimaculis]
MYLEPPLDESLTTPTVTTRGTDNSYTNQKDVGELMEILHGRVERLSDDTLKEDPKRPTWQLWKDDPACSHYYTRFGKGLTPVQLVSVPSSGSTWLRYLLEASTGFFTGSNYNDTLLYKEGFLGEKGGVHEGGTLVQRTHGAAWFLLYIHDLQDRYDYINSSIPTILLLRDPARTIISYWKMFNLEGLNKHVMEIPKRRFEGGDFHDFVDEVTSLWEEQTVDRLLWATKPLHLIHFEHLKRDPMTHLRNLLDFLSVPVNEGRLACLASHMNGAFKRNSTSATFDPFNAEEKKRFANVVRRVDRLLKVLGYPTMPLDNRLW